MRVSDLTECKLMLCALQYHEGFRHQVESWPTNPVDVMIDYLQSLPTSTVIADFGCGDAKIAHTLTKHKVLSFDLVAKNDKVVACDIAKVRQFQKSVQSFALACFSNFSISSSFLFPTTLSMLPFFVSP
jgi:hypothetical protein